jgi:hydroxymethylpyrimidine kinase/phosphomethylpyrimidine kinase
MQADLKTFQHFALHGLTAVTCIVSETANLVRRVDSVDPSMLADQILLMLDSFPLEVVKTGMLGSAKHVECVAEIFKNHPHIKLVVDPVMIASTGATLIETDAIATYREQLLPLAYLITPNLPEAETLLGETIPSVDAISVRRIRLCGSAQRRSPRFQRLHRSSLRRQNRTSLYLTTPRRPSFSRHGLHLGSRHCRQSREWERFTELSLSS